MNKLDFRTTTTTTSARTVGFVWKRNEWNENSLRMPVTSYVSASLYLFLTSISRFVDPWLIQSNRLEKWTEWTIIVDVDVFLFSLIYDKHAYNYNLKYIGVSLSSLLSFIFIELVKRSHSRSIGSETLPIYLWWSTRKTNY